MVLRYGMSTWIRGCVTLAALATALVGVPVAILVIDLHFTTERKIAAALAHKYPPQSTTILGRASWSYDNQICFDLVIRDRATGQLRRPAAMVQGDDDGGTWMVAGEYASMSACEKDFNHG
jgi:hypothetical protein